jgi:hypothetical protein
MEANPLLEKLQKYETAIEHIISMVRDHEALAAYEVRAGLSPTLIHLDEASTYRKIARFVTDPRLKI